MSIKTGSTLVQRIARRHSRPQASFHAPTHHATQHGDCFFTYWSLLGAVAGWSMTASSVLEKNKAPSLCMTQDVAMYSTFWALASLWMTQNPLLIAACHVSNVGAVLYHYLEAHADRVEIKSYRDADWQCHGEKTQQ